jgi:methylated-DNA-[protein]-cysteine S-methyltransferase
MAKIKSEELIKTYIYTIFKTPFGWMGVVKTLLGLHTVVLPKPKAEDVTADLKRQFEAGMIKDDKGLKEVKDKILNYLSGSVVRFDDLLDLSDASPFEKRVWHVVSTIPRGQVRSYAWVAENLGEPKARRAVGQALSKNRLPIIIPCHRVILKDGLLGGFSSGVKLKRELLRIEGRVW